MSQPDLINGGLYEEKPSSTIYTACLGISFLALCIVSWLLSLEMKAYDNDFKGLEAKRMVVPTEAPPLETEAPATTEGEAPADGTTDGTTDPAAPTASATGTAMTDPDGGTPATPAASGTAAPAGTATPAGTAAPAGTAPATPAASGTAAP